MKKVLALMLVLLVSMMLVVGCSDDDDDKDDNNPTGGGGGSTAGELTERTDAKNAPVTEDNIEQVTSEINQTSWDVFGRALQTVQVGKAAIDYSQKLNGEVEGRAGGKATVNGTMTTKMSGQSPSSVDYNFTCTFFDFSDDGEIWLGGSLKYVGNYNYTDMVYNIKITGDIRFNGAYQGTQTYTSEITMNATTGASTYSVTTTTTSNGQTFTSTQTF